MKKTTVLFVVLFVIALCLSFTSSSPAQSKAAQAKQLPKGAVELSGSELQSLKDQFRSGQLRASASATAIDEATASKIQAAIPIPAVAIRVVGDSGTGLYADIRSTAKIKKNSIVMGVRISPSGGEEFLFAYQFSEDLDPGSLWANLENGKKAAYNENGGIQRYEVWVIKGGIDIYSAEKDFQNGFYSEHAKMDLRDGFSSYNEDGASVFYLFGSYSNAVGVTVKPKETGWELTIPRNAVDSDGGIITVDFSKVPDFQAIPGEYYVTVVDGVTKRSSTFTMLLNPYEDDSFKAGQARLEQMKRKYKTAK